MRPPPLLLSVLLACRLAPGAELAGTTSDAAPAAGPSETGENGSSEASTTGVHVGAFALRGATLVGVGPVDLEIRDGRIAAVGDVSDGLPEVDATGRFLAPAFVDSHVHLAYRFDAPTLAAGGVAAAVDLAAPIDFLGADHAPLAVVAAGPMITAVRGYPTQSWGADGYGAEIDGVDAAREAVDRLVARGAGVIKVPVDGNPALTDAELAAVVARAHHHGRKVAAHALSDASARRAAVAGADLLAHTPVEPLGDDTVALWSRRAVVSTLSAFGGSADAVDNLRRLRAAGTTVLYGTDLGNTSIPGIDPNELALLAEAGLDAEAILAAGTAVPAAYWGFEGLGTIAAGARASFLLLDADPTVDPQALASPSAVYLDGVLRG